MIEGVTYRSRLSDEEVVIVSVSETEVVYRTARVYRVGPRNFRRYYKPIAPAEPLTAVELDAQGQRCACRGLDAWCACQNAVDEQTKRERLG